MRSRQIGNHEQKPRKREGGLSIASGLLFYALSVLLEYFTGLSTLRIDPTLGLTFRPLADLTGG